MLAPGGKVDEVSRANVCVFTAQPTVQSVQGHLMVGHAHFRDHIEGGGRQLCRGFGPLLLMGVAWRVSLPSGCGEAAPPLQVPAEVSPGGHEEDPQVPEGLWAAGAGVPGHLHRPVSGGEPGVGGRHQQPLHVSTHALTHALTRTHAHTHTHAVRTSKHTDNIRQFFLIRKFVA